MTRQQLRRPAAQLWALGLGSVLVYALTITARYPLLAWIAKPGLVWANKDNQPLWVGWLHGTAYVLLTLLLLGALRATRAADPADRGVTRAIVAVWLLAALTLLLAAPAGESHDLFDYTYRGRWMAELGISPLAVAPAEAARQPFYGYLSWFGSVDTYGPLWEYASATVAQLVGAVLRLTQTPVATLSACGGDPAGCGALAAYLTGYRLLAVGMTGVSAALIANLVRRVTPQLVPAALVVWLWSPVSLLSNALGGHNDALMVALVLLTLTFVQRGRWVAGLLVLLLAAHVKLTALLLVPPIGVWLLARCGWSGALWRAAAAGAAGLACSWVLYAPLDGWQTLPRMLYERALFVTNSPANALYVALQNRWGWSEPSALALVSGGSNAAFLLLAALLVWLFAQAVWPGQRAAAPADDRPLWWAAALTLLLYLAVGAYWFQPWYLLWVLAPAALRPARWVTARLLPWLGCGALCANLVSDYSYAPVMTPLTRTAQAAAVAGTIWIFPALALLWAVWRWRRIPAGSVKEYQQWV